MNKTKCNNGIHVWSWFMIPLTTPRLLLTNTLRFTIYEREHPPNNGYGLLSLFIWPTFASVCLFSTFSSHTQFPNFMLWAAVPTYEVNFRLLRFIGDKVLSMFLYEFKDALTTLTRNTIKTISVTRNSCLILVEWLRWKQFSHIKKSSKFNVWIPERVFIYVFLIILI